MSTMTSSSTNMQREEGAMAAKPNHDNPANSLGRKPQVSAPMRPTHSTRLALVAFCLIASTLGCASGKSNWKFASWDVRKAVGMKKGDDKPDPEIPARLVSTWSEAVLNRTGETSKRGFGGRLAFFKSDSKDPVRVNGQLVVYAFDETSRPLYETQPTRRYVFPAEQLSLYESPSALGPSYSVWLPWDEAGGPGRKISLIARFEPKDGPVIVSEQTKHYLAGPMDGPTNSREQQYAAVDEGVRTASFSAPVAASALPPAGANETSILAKPSMETATISLPRRLSPTGGAPLYEPRNAAASRTQATPRTTEPPQMPGVTAPGALQSPTQQPGAAPLTGLPISGGIGTSTGLSAMHAASQRTYGAHAHSSGGPATNGPKLDPVTGYLLAPTIPQQPQQPLAGYQPVQPQVQGTPIGR